MALTLKMEKCVESWLQKQKWSHFIDFVLTDRRSLSVKRPKSAGGKSSSCRFSSSAQRNANTKATEYVTCIEQTACIENREGPAVHSLTWSSGAKGEWRASSCMIDYINTRGKIPYFFTCCYGFSQYRKSLYNTAVYVIKEDSFHRTARILLQWNDKTTNNVWINCLVELFKW